MNIMVKLISILNKANILLNYSYWLWIVMLGEVIVFIVFYMHKHKSLEMRKTINLFQTLCSAMLVVITKAGYFAKYLRWTVGWQELSP